jgi:hypothetical protein
VLVLMITAEEERVMTAFTGWESLRECSAMQDRTNQAQTPSG